ncbi:MAG: hypothetical protein JWM12_2816 [Ilumatobacteraceae bacterium]|nr:hypothetical protein [Ilumatobacteraceae bacterium]
MQPTEQSRTDTQPDRELAESPSVTFYWRPGCPFCRSLRSGLDRAGVLFDDVNIWDDPAAAAFVRSVAGGNETVPTVTVGKVARVNPSVGDVVELLDAATGGR